MAPSKKTQGAKKTAVKKPASSTKAAVKKRGVTKNTSSKRAGRTSVKKATAPKAAKKPQSKKAVSKKAVSNKTATPRSGAANTKAAATKVKKSSPKPKKRSIATKSKLKDRTIPAAAKYLRDQKWLDGQREVLLQERAKYTTSADRLAAEAAALMADREPGDVQFDEESGEGDTIAVERDRDLALSAAARQAVDDIDSALARLDSNTYGLCTAGDDVIPKDRLEAIPEAAVCVQHKTSMF